MENEVVLTVPSVDRAPSAWKVLDESRRATGDFARHRDVPTRSTTSQHRNYGYIKLPKSSELFPAHIQ
jgi:hypothetical protein